MVEKKLTEIELHKIHRDRNRTGYFLYILSLAVSLYFQREFLVTDSRWWFVVFLISLGTVLRILIGEVFYNSWCKKEKWAIGVNVTAFFLLACGLGLHFWDVYYHYGPSAPNVSYTLLIIVAFITGSSTSLIADKISYFTFVITLSVIVALSFFIDPHFSNAYVLLNIILYLAFSISNYKVSNNQLMDLLASKINISKEKERFAEIINTVPGFVGFVSKDLKVYRANQLTLSLYPDILGKTIGTIHPNSDWEKSVIDFMASDKTMDVFESHTVNHNEEIHALLNIQRSEDGGAIIVSIITTELVLAQKKLREQEAKSQYTAKLASLGEMAAGIAHEVNNPLTIIQGTANIIRRLVDQAPIDSENVKSLADKMIETSERISKTVKSLKALSRNGENDPKEIFPLVNVINKCVDISGQRFKQNGVDWRMNDVSPGIKVLGREVQLSQVLINLINNSIDALKNSTDRWISLSVVQVDHFIEITFQDSGLGIPEEIHQKIMDPFFTTKDVNQGTGLGLSISKNIIQDHGGELLLLSKEKNTTFRIKLPLVD